MFNEQEQIRKMTPHVEKLVNHLRQYNIEYFSSDEGLDNVVFQKDDKIFKIAYLVFYRYCGICKIQKQVKGGKENEIEWLDISDSMYINSFIKPIIKMKFDIMK